MMRDMLLAIPQSFDAILATLAAAGRQINRSDEKCSLPIVFWQDQP